MFDFELTGKKQNGNGKNLQDLFVIHMSVGDKTKNCAIDYSLLDLSINDEDLKKLIDKGIIFNLAKKKLKRDKEIRALDNLRIGIESMITSFLADK